MLDLERDLEAYATLAAGLSDPRADRAAMLARHGLSEAAWEAIDDAWQARLAGVDDDDGETGIPCLLAAYAEAFARAQRARASTELPFERFLEAARVLKRGTDLTTALRRLDLTLEDFLAAERRWTAAMIEDEALAERFRRGILG